MSTLEIHTLNQATTEFAGRAGDGAIAGRLALREAEKSPDSTGDFSFEDIQVLSCEPQEKSPAVSVIGDYMPAVEKAHEDYELLQESELIGDLMLRARLSKLTGCIMPDLSRDHKGYTSTGIKAVKELGLGTTSRQTHRVVHFARLAEKTGRLPTAEELHQQVDHICRNPACIYHTRLIDGDINNELMAEAREIEPDILAGKVFYVSDRLPKMPWLSFTIASEGDIPPKVISTRLGPFALWRASETEMIVYGQRMSCEVYDSLKGRGKKPDRRKSRAKLKMPASIKGHMDMFPKTKYRKRHIPTAEELYAAAAKSA